MIRKEVMIVLITFCLTATLFSIIPVGSQGVREYDPWYDINDDGKIDLKDYFGVGLKYGTSGTPINKTALLLELQSRVNALEGRYPTGWGVILIPPVDFTPGASGTIYSVSWDMAYCSPTLYAYLQLPNGINITRMVAKIYDGKTGGFSTINLRLYRYAPIDHTLQEMGLIGSSDPGAPGYVVISDYTIAYSVIDNNNYAYFLDLYMSVGDSNLYLSWVALEYQ